MSAIVPITIALMIAFVAASLALILIFVFSPPDPDDIDDMTKWSVVALVGCICAGMLTGLHSLAVAL